MSNNETIFALILGVSTILNWILLFFVISKLPMQKGIKSISKHKSKSSSAYNPMDDEEKRFYVPDEVDVPNYE